MSCLSLIRRLSECDADCNLALNLTPNNLEADLNRGLAHYKQEEYQAASADLEKAALYFGDRGETTAYNKTLDALNNLRQQLPYFSEIALI
ncbi:hypothetical protein [Chlorogloeopsis sp. ULAP02]|uniref:hypothetical protein n=1 Tax=Chlorogloeopsis sp. ULAP02 TaxID=3107926 RepID=UPI00313708F9